MEKVTSKMLIEVEQELRDLKVKSYVEVIKSQGWEAIVYECLECLYYRGKFVMPKTYEYREALVEWYKEHIDYKMKCWLKGNE